MSRTLVIAVLATLLVGCGIVSPRHLGGIATPVEPEDYGQRLCGHLNLEDYSACLSEVLAYFEVPRPDSIPAGHSTSGPFVVVLGQQVFMGDYRSTPFSASFEVRRQGTSCRGSYDGLGASADALFDVYCTDGRSGWADIILDTDGRNGIGKLALDDGTQGHIVFGYLPLGQAEPYPYRP